MEGQNTDPQRKPSVVIPPALFAHQWSNRHGTEHHQYGSNIPGTPTGYSPEEVRPIQRGWSIKRPFGGRTQDDPIPLHPHVHIDNHDEPDDQEWVGERPEYSRRYYAGQPYPESETQNGLYTIYDQPSSANSAIDLSNNASQPLNVHIPPRRQSVDEPYGHGDDAALLHSSRRQQPKRKAQSPIEATQAAFYGAANAVTRAVRRTETWKARREELRDMQGYAKLRNAERERHTVVQILFQAMVYLFILAVIYFVFVGVPLWKGATQYMYYLLTKVFVMQYGYTIFVGIAFVYAFLPLLIFFEKYPKQALPHDDQRVKETALLIPCYKSAALIENTIKCALKVFPARNIFVIANGNSPEPLDNTAEIVAPYGVNHIWSSVGSKIVAQFVGCYAAEEFKNVLLIDDDCALPPNFPIVSDRLKGNIKCIGYTIKSVGPDSSRGTLCQQAQDLEYKLSGLQRAIAGNMGSCTFAHGAINLWDRKFLIETFHGHPGFSVSEDWFFGHVARKLGSRITMCTSVFVETETPSAIFVSSGGSRGGFGEMTIWKQRFFRWNFFFVNGIFYNLAYILFSWNLGFWEIGAKLFVLQEIYETLLYIMAPFILPMSFMINPMFTGIMMGGTTVIYLFNAIIFNEIHLRLKKERVTWACILYYMWYKFVLTFVNILSCYWSIFKYAQYFAVRHPKVVEDEKALGVVLNLDIQEDEKADSVGQSQDSATQATQSHGPRRGMSIRTKLTTVSNRPLEEHDVGWNNSGGTLINRITSVRGTDRRQHMQGVPQQGDMNV